jgi:membrane associated rhomboid family serine protease
VFPIGDESAGTIIKPYVNWALIAICFAVFVYEFVLPTRQLNAFFYSFGVIPADIVQLQNLYTLFTSMFLHGGIAHLLGNMLFLYVFGDNIEDAMGHVSYLLFYLLTGVAASGLQIALDPTSTIPLIGASGAISGVMGAYIVLFPQGRIRAIVIMGVIGTVLVPAWIMIGLWFLLQLFSGFMSLGVGGNAGGVAFWAHVGGFIAGAILVFLFRDRNAVARQNAVRGTHQAYERVPAGSRGRR